MVVRGLELTGQEPPGALAGLRLWFVALWSTGVGSGYKLLTVDAQPFQCSVSAAMLVFPPSLLPRCNRQGRDPGT